MLRAGAFGDLWAVESRVLTSQLRYRRPDTSYLFKQRYAGSGILSWLGCHILDLLFSGILPRFPELKFVSVESGVGWVPFVLQAADYQFGQLGVRAERPEFELLPSEYFHRQVHQEESK